MTTEHFAAMAEEQQDLAPLQPASDAVCVAVHIRPLVQSELAEGCQMCLSVTPGRPQASSHPSGHLCCLDIVFYLKHLLPSACHDHISTRSNRSSIAALLSS